MTKQRKEMTGKVLVVLAVVSTNLGWWANALVGISEPIAHAWTVTTISLLAVGACIWLAASPPE